MIIEVKCIVSQKNVVKVMEALDGLTLEPPVYQPIKAAAPNGKAPAPLPHEFVVDAPKGSYDSTKLVFSYIDKAIENGAKIIDTKDLTKLMEENGKPKGNYYYGLKKLVANKTLKPKGDGIYEVIK